MSFQNDAIEFVIPVVDKSGNTIDAGDYIDAVFRIGTITGVELFSAQLGNGISVVDGAFHVTAPSTATNHSGRVLYEMRVWTTPTSSKTILQSTDNFVTTTIGSTQP
ncbi:hypothetical protein [Neptunicella sp. SCSIO 80796]|uniref:hypothetical protein n=1 Tax=Neptunicella plasticusilytica TaxID=3117012 RepID=UPI003A4DA39B